MFYVIEGSVTVKIAMVEFEAAKGTAFAVPRGKGFTSTCHQMN